MARYKTEKTASEGKIDLSDVSQPTKENEDRLCFSIPETARMLGISRGLAYELAHSGQIPVLRLGKRLLVPKIALERMLGQTETPGENREANRSRNTLTEVKR
jgi:excisionase family DNA binding protein